MCRHMLVSTCYIHTYNHTLDARIFILTFWCKQQEGVRWDDRQILLPFSSASPATDTHTHTRGLTWRGGRHGHTHTHTRGLTWRGGRHGPALDAGTEGSAPLAGEGLHADVIGGVWLQALDGHLRVGGGVGGVLLAVDVPVHHQVLDDPPVPLGQRGRVPGQGGGALAQIHHAQVLGVAARHILRGAHRLDMLLTGARAVLGTQSEDVGGSLVEAGDGEVVVRLLEVLHSKSPLLSPLVLQLVTRVLPDHLLGGLPLDQSCVADGGADHHGGLARDWRDKPEAHVLFMAYWNEQGFCSLFLFKNGMQGMQPNN